MQFLSLCLIFRNCATNVFFLFSCNYHYLSYLTLVRRIYLRLHIKIKFKKQNPDTTQIVIKDGKLKKDYWNDCDQLWIYNFTLFVQHKSKFSLIFQPSQKMNPEFHHSSLKYICCKIS